MSSSELILVGVGSFGDIYPLVALARKLKKDFRTTLVANEYYTYLAEQNGLDFFPAGTEEEQLSVLEGKNSTGETRDGCIARFEGVIGKNFSRLFSYIENRFAENKNIIVISHGNLSPAALACEKFNIPMIMLHYSPQQVPGNIEDSILTHTFLGKKEWYLRKIRIPLDRIKRQFTFDVRSSYNNYRSQFGLHPLRNPIQSFIASMLRKPKGYRLFVPLSIALYPEWFGDPSGGHTDRITYAGFPFYDDVDDENRAKADAFIEEHGSPIVFTPGSAVSDVLDFCQAVPSACRALEAPAIFLSRHGQHAYERLAAECGFPFLYLKQVDLNYLLPKSRLLVHHGGIGTLAAAVRAGVPQIIRPRMYDQTSNAIRSMLYGLGGTIFPHGYSGKEIARIFKTLDNNPKHKSLLKYYSTAVQDENGVGNAAKAISDYALNYSY